MALTKTELKKQLKAIGISTENDCVRKSELHKILSDTTLPHDQAKELFIMIGGLSRIAKELKKEDNNKDVLIRHLEDIVHKLDVWAEKMV